LIQVTAGGQGIACPLSDALIRGCACTGMAQEAHVTGLVDHKEVFARVPVLLPPVLCWLLFGIGRALERPCSPIVPKKGVVEPPPVAGVSNIAANSAAVRAGSSAWSAQA
jgi:hypothetical protein